MNSVTPTPHSAKQLSSQRKHKARNNSRSEKNKAMKHYYKSRRPTTTMRQSVP